MKKFVFFSLLIGLAHSLLGQMVCGYVNSDSTELRAPQYIYNGGDFTPKGDLRVLIVFVKFGGIYDTMYVEGWNNGDFPDWAMSSNEAAFYH